MCYLLGTDMRGLGELRRRDPMQFAFLENAVAERFRMLYGK